MNQRQWGAPLAVVVEDQVMWQAALIRAQEHHLTATTWRAYNDPDAIRYGYWVPSGSRKGVRYGVVVTRFNDGRVTVSCECESARGQGRCQHAATALQTARLWPFPIAEQTEMQLPL